MHNFDIAQSKHTPKATKRVAVVDGYGKPEHPKVNIVATLETDALLPLADAGHAGMVMGRVGNANTDKHPVEVIDVWTNRSFSTMTTQIQRCVREGYEPNVICTAYDVDGGEAFAYAANYTLREAGVIWVGPSRDSLDFPSDLPDDNVLAAMCIVDGHIRDAYRPFAIGVEAPNVSAATGELSGKVAWLWSLKPSAPYTEVLHALKSGCDIITIDGYTVKYLNMDRSAYLLVGEPVVQPIPTPIPAMDILTAENEFVVIKCSDELVNDEKGEGLENMLNDDTSKTLWWTNNVTLNITAKQDCWLVGYRTANDQASRDLSYIEAEYDAVDLSESQEPRHSKVEFKPLLLSEGPNEVVLFNKGAPYTQVEYLYFADVVEEPEPERTVVSMVLTYSDGTEEVWAQ